MASRNSDVTLVVRARDEAQKTIDGVAAALQSLLKAQDGVSASAGKTSNSIADLAKIAGSLDKAYASISGGADRAAAAFERQQKAINEQKAALAGMQAEAQSAAAAIAKLNSATAIVDAGRDQSGRLAQVKAATAAYETLQSQISRTSSSIATQERALGTSASSLQVLSSQANAVEAAVSKARVAIDQQTASLEKQQRASARNSAVGSSINGVTGISRGSATDNGATYSALDAQMRKTTDSAQRLREALNPRISTNNQIREAIALYRQQAITVDELRARIKQLRDTQTQSTGNAKIGLFGLRPYELQNLSYQINDIVTQLGSGTSLSQTLAQQGGQIFQLFQGRLSAAVGGFASGPVALAIASVTTLVVLLNRAADNAERVRKVSAVLATNGNGGDYDATKVAEAAKQFERYGVSASDAIKVVRTFVKDGIPQANFEAFGKTAKDLADVLGTDVADAAQQLGSAFNGTYEGIAKLDDATNLLTDSERTRIRTLFEQGKAQDAMRIAYEAMAGRLEKGAQDMRGPWAEATRALGKAWSDFLDYLSNTTVIKAAAGALTSLATAISETLKLLDSGTKSADVLQQITDKMADIAKLKKEIAANPDNNLLKIQLGDSERGLEALKKQYAELNKAEGGTGVVPTTAGVKPAPALPTESPELKKQSDETLEEMKRERDLQALRDKGAKAVQNLRVRNEKFLSDAEQRRREALAGELAATKAVGDQRVKDAARAAAIAEERTKIQSEQDSYNQSSGSAAMQARQFIIGKEGFRSSAYWDVNHYRVGYGSDTTTDAAGNVSTVTKGTTVSLEGALRDLDRRIGEFQNAIKSTIGTDRFNSFSAQQQAAVTSVAYNYGKLPDRILTALRSGSSADIAAAIEGLQNDNGGVNRGRRLSEAATFRTSNVALDQSTAKIAEDTQDALEKSNRAIDEGNRKLNERTDELNKQAGLTGKALLDVQKREAGEKAVNDAIAKRNEENAQRAAANKPGLGDLTPAQIAAIRSAAENSVATRPAVAQATLADVQRPVDELTAKRDAIQSQIGLFSAQGNIEKVDQLTQSLNGVNGELEKAIANLIKFYQDPNNAGLLESLGKTKEQIDATVTSLQNAQLGTRQWISVLGISGQQIAQTFASTAVSAIDQFAQAVASGKNAFKSLGEAFLTFAAQFLRQIAQMILQQLIFNAISGLFSAGAGAAGSAAASGGTSLGAFAGVMAHSGGVIGDSSTYGTNTGPRAVMASWYANATRYHTGGIAGLAPNEVPAVLQRGEEVLTANDPRHRNNSGGGGGAAPQIKIVNAIDASDMVSQGLNTSAGEKAVLNLVRNNPGAFKAAMG